MHLFPSPTRSEALFPPVLSWLMFVWINIEQEAMLAQGVSGRQEVETIKRVSKLRFRCYIGNEMQIFKSLTSACLCISL